MVGREESRKELANHVEDLKQQIKGRLNDD